MIEFSEVQSLKVSEKSVTLEGIVIEVKEVQSSKIFLSISSIPSDITIEAKDEHFLKALSLIFLILFGIVIEVKEVQPLKAPNLISTTPSDI